ncbi:tropomodulin-2-like [Antedon mediterranea]|uniref:tropomodulin-2-like n=1 Tax=Antedon mediterranea TaxID=105859 RepID=UPI003AF50A59
MYGGYAPTGMDPFLDDHPKYNTFIYEAVKNIQDNNPDAVEINLNNRKKIPICELAEGLKTNTHLLKLSMACTNINDTDAKAIADGLKGNKSLTSLNLESNFITGTGMTSIMEALLLNDTLTELRVSNQRSKLGTHAEMYIAEVLSKNTSIVKLGLTFDHTGPRGKADACLMKNNDIARKKRLSNKAK